MIKGIIIVLITAIPFFLNAQILKGRVYIANTNKVIAGASVYYNGSSIGTITNEYGDFSLPTKFEMPPIIISFIGYSSAVVEVYKEENNIKVYLTPVALQLREVIISSGNDGMSRAEKERLFLQDFLGTTKFAVNCRIRNLKDIVLTYNKKTKTLKAYCYAPIEIENKMLGYSLQYFLDIFIRSPQNVTIGGNFIFRESPNTDPKINRNRQEAYFGSRMQFIRALWNNSLKENGFNIYSKLNKPVIEDSLLIEVGSKKYIKVKDKVIITYHSKKLSSLYQIGDRALIGKNGFYNAFIHWSGLMGLERVGDMLPYEYNP